MTVGKLTRGVFWVVAFVFVIGALIRVAFVEVWKVPDEDKISAAVAPSLRGGDTILYMRRNKPAFGDLVRCTDPDDAGRFVVGRVVGLWGDTVEVNGRELSVNGKRYIGEMVCAEDKLTIPHPTSGSTVEISCDQVEIAGHPHMRGAGDKALPEKLTKTSVGQGKLYLLSDDRTYHDDSRDFGTLATESCTGRIVFRLWGKEGMADTKRRMTFVQ